MRFRILGLGSALLLPLLSAHPASAQRVQADIRIGGGPVAGHIRIGDRGDYRRDGDYRPRRIRVEVVRYRDRESRDGWFRDFNRRARVVVVYYDRRDDCYYDRFRPGLEEIQVFERDGRFYRMEDDRFDRRYDDRYNGRNDGRYDDRSDGRYDGRYDDRTGRDNRGARDPRGNADPRGGRGGDQRDTRPPARRP